MAVLYRDVESRSTLNLTDVGAWRYAADPATEVLCIGYAIDNGAVQVWMPGQPIPNEFTIAARDPAWLIVAHNDQFEAAIEEHLLHPRYDWQLVPIERHRCTMAMALANALPGSLESAAAALGLPIGKDSDGHRLMMQMAKPRTPRKGEDPNVIHWHDDPERRLRLQEYCIRDVAVTRELYKRLSPLSADEQKLWEFDAKINGRGFHVDLQLAEATRKIVHEEEKAINAEIAELTGGKITSVHEVAKITAHLQELGYDVTDLTKKSVSALLAQEPEGDGKRLLELRQQGAQAAARKLDSLIAGGDPKLEPYCVTASRILRREVTPEDEFARAIGKVCDLAFGYGGGRGAHRRFDPSDTYTDDQVEAFKREWRSTHAATVRFWHDLENCLCRALRTGQRVVLGNLSAEVVDSTLYLTLPSGRRLAYPEAHLEPGKFGRDEIVFKDNGRGGWLDQRGWRGTFTENVVQAVARDLLAAAMLRLEAAGYPIVLHVHDEIVAEVPEGFGSPKEFLDLMTMLPDWATGLPVAAKVWMRKCYAKPAAITPPVAVIEKPALKISSHDAIAKKIIAIGRPLINGKNGVRGDHVDWRKTWNGPVALPCCQSADDSTLALALQIWNVAQPIAGTLAIRYLAEVRGIDTDALPDTISTTLRFHSNCVFGSGIRLPCLIALYRDVVSDAPAGIHRIALTADVFAGGKVQRLTLGSWPTPRAFKLWPATDQLFLGEGIETVLAAATRLHYRAAPMRPAWAAGSSGNIRTFPVLDKVKALTLLVDHDASGEFCSNICRQRWREANRTVTRLQTDRLRTDFNDLVLERCAS